MRQYLHINLRSREVKSEEFAERSLLEPVVFIANSLLEMGVAKVDPLIPDNPLIFSAGPFAGSNFSNANRTSVGCKSPLTGGIKEANAGGSFGLALGQMNLAGLRYMTNVAIENSVMHIGQDGKLVGVLQSHIWGRATLNVQNYCMSNSGAK